MNTPTYSIAVETPPQITTEELQPICDKLDIKMTANGKVITYEADDPFLFYKLGIETSVIIIDKLKENVLH